MQILVLEGAAAAPIVEPHYHRNDFSGVKARPEDVFFIATSEGPEVLGCVRFCKEEDVALLRTMAVDEPHRNTGIGLALLKHFEKYLQDNGVRQTYLVCKNRLNPFYARIGFERIAFESAPLFLQERMRKYDPELAHMTCMMRES